MYRVKCVVAVLDNKHVCAYILSSRYDGVFSSSICCYSLLWCGITF